MGNYWINKHDKIEEMQEILKNQIQKYLFEPLNETVKKKIEAKICSLLSQVWDDIEQNMETQLTR